MNENRRHEDGFDAAVLQMREPDNNHFVLYVRLHDALSTGNYEKEDRTLDDLRRLGIGMNIGPQWHVGPRACRAKQDQCEPAETEATL